MPQTRSPITQYPDGPVSGVIGAIATRENVTPDMVLMAWTKAKGAVVVTYVLLLVPAFKRLPLIHRVAPARRRSASRATSKPETSVRSVPSTNISMDPDTPLA